MQDNLDNQKFLLFTYILTDEWKAFKTGNEILRAIRSASAEASAREWQLQLVQQEIWQMIQEKFPWIALFENPDCSVNPDDLGWGLFCYLEELTTLSKKYRLGKIDRHTEKIISELVKHICESGSVSTASKELGMDRHELNQILRKKLGISATEYSNMLKLERAAYLLAAEKKNTNEIAENLGYTSADTFSKKFRERFGCRPEQYKKNAFA